MQKTRAEQSSRLVAIWILTGVAMLLIQVILGGITRLTGSGLSITEWNVVTGTLPPLNAHQWTTEFDKYKSTPQFQLLNTEFTLKDFKFIFFWEWLHRFWARLIGIVFIAGFGFLVAHKDLKKEMVKPLLVLFLLGALQGTIGWVMVASGLTGDAVYVKPTRLALHFVFALGLIVYAFLVALKLLIPEKLKIINPRVKSFTWMITVLLIVQLIFGALMAGHKAANAAPTWPDINGSLIPASLFTKSPFLLNLIGNKITIHFIHRTVAYFLLILTIILTLKLNKANLSAHPWMKYRWIPFGLIVLQVSLGIFTVLASRDIVPNQWGLFEWMAQFHQVTGMLLLLCFTALLYLVRRKSFIPAS